MSLSLPYARRRYSHSNRVIINKQGGELVSYEAPQGFSTHGMFYWREVSQ